MTQNIGNEESVLKQNDSENKPKKNGKRNSKNSSVKRPTQKYPIVEIWWDDPTALTHGWLDNSELRDSDTKPALVLSVGFLVKETEEYIIYASDLDKDGNHNGRTKIPKPVVKRIRILRKPDNT